MAALVLSFGIALPAAAQQGSIKILAGFPAGASLDAMTRLVADKMQASLGQTVIVENRTGAGGQIAAFMGTVSDVAPQHKAGKVHAVATSGAKRSKHLPEVPTFRELGYDIEGGGWYAAYAPAGTPANVVERLSQAIIAGLHAHDVHEKLDTFGMEPTGLGPADLARIRKRDHDQWGPVIKASGFKPGS